MIGMRRRNVNAATSKQFVRISYKESISTLKAGRQPLRVNDEFKFGYPSDAA